MTLIANILLCAALLVAPGPTLADLIPPAGQRRSLPLTLVDDRPFLATRVNGAAGLAMFDTGTPFALLVNRAAVPLDAGRARAGGTAASGQSIQIRDHAPTAGMQIAGLDAGLTGPVQSADLAFVADGLGLALIGFIGAPMVARGAFALNYDQSRMVVLGTDANGELADPPKPDEVLAEVAVLWPDGDPPLFAGTVGGQPLLIDLDTGDVGTLYLSAATMAAWRGAELLTEGPEGAVLHGLAFGGADFAPQPVRLVTAGGPDDHRPSGHPDLLRLGGRFLRQHPTLWNLAGHRFTVLRDDSAPFD